MAAADVGLGIRAVKVFASSVHRDVSREPWNAPDDLMLERSRRSRTRFLASPS
jgi:hypothetical protein